ncbi:hypothetical protein LAZ67_3004385 [Cordylochernes scorpioides]|uniref:Transposase n=1 Tax=Cordylochernes scorpioides TaxID=51811 RepID=A0ABY6KAB9_9ARAC|nr:hypothetical protein LAZ67_3004385 [Cordylochernes scorpioides]
MDESEIQDFQREMLKNRTKKEVRQSIGHELTDMLISCKFTGEPSLEGDNCTSRFAYIYDPAFGNCYTFMSSGTGDGLVLTALEGDAWQKTTIFKPLSCDMEYFRERQKCWKPPFKPTALTTGNFLGRPETRYTQCGHLKESKSRSELGIAADFAIASAVSLPFNSMWDGVDWKGLVHYEIVPEGQTINQHYYLDVLRSLREAVRQKRPEKWHKKNCLLHHYNARPHTAVTVQLYLAEHGIALLPQPPYSPDIAPNDFFFYPKIKKVLKGRRFDSISEIKENSNNILKSLKDEDFQRCQRSAGKVLLTIFWDVDGPICLDFLSSRQRMNSDLYCDILVNKLKPGIRNKRRRKLSKGVLFLHDDARPHTSCKTVSTIIKLGFEVLEHPAYSPDLASSDYFLFGLLKKELKGKRFDSDEDVQKVVQDFFHPLPKSAYKEGIYKLPERWRRCIESQGDYF